MWYLIKLFQSLWVKSKTRATPLREEENRIKDIKVRKVDKEILNKLTEISKKNGFKNRNEYIIKALSKRSLNVSYADKLEDEYVLLIKRLLKLLEYNKEVLEVFKNDTIDISRFF